MSWIKRNLYFVIGSVVSVLLLGLAGWFLYTKWDLNNQVRTKLNDDYEALRKLNSEPLHPGAGQINNTQASKDQQKELREFLKKAREYFQPIAAIPDMPKPTDRDFSAALSRTIDQLRRDANAASVTLPEKYNFSFEAQVQALSFEPKSLAALSVQLGDVKAICDVLLQARINALDAIRRERISTEDNKGTATDYLNDKTTTNELAALTPYETTFRCFSSELAAVLSGFASSPAALLVKSINVEQGSSTSSTAEQLAAAAPFIAPMVPGAMPGPGGINLMRAYGPFGGGGAYGPFGGGQRNPVAAAPTPAPAGATTTAASASAHGGLPTVLDEKLLKITMAVYVVKLLPAK